MDEEAQERFPIDHAGRQETSLMMAFCPEGVDMARFSGKKWYCRETRQATAQYGGAARGMILEAMRRILAPQPKTPARPKRPAARTGNRKKA